MYFKVSSDGQLFSKRYLTEYVLLVHFLEKSAPFVCVVNGSSRNTTVLSFHQHPTLVHIISRIHPHNKDLALTS
jgi:hypothetical protein